MAKYLLAYRGGSMAETPEEQEKVMGQWMAWFGELGAAVVDGGAPFGPSSTLGEGGATTDGGSAALTGYSVIEAGDLAAANALAKGCPVLTNGGTVDVYESLPM
jgi:hypothetical protein